MLISIIKQKAMKITAELSAELIKEENSLKVCTYFGAFINGDFRYMVALSTETEKLIFEFIEN